MPAYKFYPLNEHGHIVEPPHIVEADSDAQAFEKARRLIDGHDLEAWQGARRVGLLKREK